MDVTCAIIRDEEGRILIVQRGGYGDHPFKWEFPGGKVKKGETPEDCIIREIDEELNMDIIISGRLESVEYDYGYKQVRLLPFICDTLDLSPVLNEHNDYKWIQENELVGIDFCEADVIVAGKYTSSVNKLTDQDPAQEDSKSEEQTDSDLQEVINRMMSVEEVDFMALSAAENPEILSRLFEYSGSSDRKLAFRASWALSKLCDRASETLIPWSKVIVKTILQTDNESVERSFLRILTLLDIGSLDQNHQGLIADHCFKALNSGTSAIAVKAYSMEIIYKLAVLYPDLANELAVSVNMIKGEGSAGIKARGRIILKKLAEISRGQQSSP
ncbi:MAG: (deoxy)nucleoside triphosphate pyrophosphohydrolase [Bacteroidales bacterium]|nr:(deoxy)nucleoside triphosphate pyrophosphohydrolase [Bacteroidales bacterium]